MDENNSNNFWWDCYWEWPLCIFIICTMIGFIVHDMDKSAIKEKQIEAKQTYVFYGNRDVCTFGTPNCPDCIKP